jgi:hypothetical protein
MLDREGRFRPTTRGNNRGFGIGREISQNKTQPGETVSRTFGATVSNVTNRNVTDATTASRSGK